MTVGTSATIASTKLQTEFLPQIFTATTIYVETECVCLAFWRRLGPRAQQTIWPTDYYIHTLVVINTKFYVK